MNIYTNATITTADDAADVALQGLAFNGSYRVTFTGDTLTITAEDDRGRWTRLDQLVNVTKTEPKKGKGVTFDGISTMLRDNVRLHEDEAHISIIVTGEECLSCL